jgi:hypothetical protein
MPEAMRIEGSTQQRQLPVRLQSSEALGGCRHCSAMAAGSEQEAVAAAKAA